MVSLVPSITDTLFEFGLADRVVGTTRYCPKHSLSSSTSIGGTKKVSLKKIIDLKPDIIIANIEENDKEDVEELMETFPVFVTYPKNY
ncbi:MAG: helical backbone metal receptor, partial [Candidatus Heimdallarchaeota archaeon]|nr:helical backbone metal receptor [Candidatus Heimdallarchaeota archaeon]